MHYRSSIAPRFRLTLRTRAKLWLRTLVLGALSMPALGPGWGVPTYGSDALPYPSPMGGGQPMLVQTVQTVGNTLTLNGIRVSIPWIQQGGKVAIADYGLTDHMGLRLLNSEAVERQPVQWFPASGQGPLVLPALVQGGYRYLDITPLVERYGWAIAVQGQTLQINTPPTQIQSIRHERQPGGDRWVIQVSGPTVTQLTEAAGIVSLTLGATASDSLVSSVTSGAHGSGPNPLQITPVGGHTRLTVQLTNPKARPQLAFQANPPQITVDIRPDALQPLNILWAPGLRWRQQFIQVGGEAFPVYWLQINPRQVGLTLRPIWTDPTTATGLMPLQTMAQRWQAIAAINTGFFNRNNQYPLGALRYNREWISGPILNRAVVGWTDQGQMRMDRLFLKQTLTTTNGQTFPIQAVNSGYVQAGIGLYTPAWGPTYRPILGRETVVTVVNNQVVNQQLLSADSPTSVLIPPNGYLLAVRSYTAAAQALPPGIGVSLASELLPASLEPFPHLVGGGPLLFRDRVMVLDPELEQFSRAFATQAAPRSAIGTTPSGDWLLVAVHLSPAGSGPTLSQLAQIMAQLGSTDALNVDGGSSASLYLGGRLINRQPFTAARVNNGLGVFLP